MTTVHKGENRVLLARRSFKGGFDMHVEGYWLEAALGSEEGTYPVSWHGSW